jgi:hypothetical protein
MRYQKQVAELNVKCNVKLSLWSAIKMRIAGLNVRSDAFDRCYIPSSLPEHCSDCKVYMNCNYQCSAQWGDSWCRRHSNSIIRLQYDKDACIMAAKHLTNKHNCT